MNAGRVPHQDIPDRPFELVSGLVCLGLLAMRRGPFDPVTLGAASSSAPDLEHIVPWLRPGGRKLFHRPGGATHAGGLPTSVQLVLAGAIVGVLLAPGGRRPAGRRRVMFRPTCHIGDLADFDEFVVRFLRDAR